MSGRLAGKVALVTGSSQGIGKATALAFAKEGATVIVNYHSNRAKADEVVSEIGANRAIALGADLSSLGEARKLISDTVDKYSRIDILALNAGVANQDGALENVSEEDFDSLFNTNVKSPFFMIKEAAPHMPVGGRIILFSTSLTNTMTIPPEFLLYVSTKGAIEQMTRVLAKDLGRKGITVNAIAPGPTSTEGFYAGKTEEQVKMVASENPQNRVGEPHEVATVVAMVAFPEAQWLTGQIIRVNGGMTVG